MENVKQLSSGIMRAGDRVEDKSWPMAPESRPTGKYDPEFDVATTTQWLRAHAQLLFELSESTDSVENHAIPNLLTHVNELLLFTLGWLEAQQASQPSPKSNEMILAVREVYARVRRYVTRGSGTLIELGLCFEDLSNALPAL